MGTQPVCVASRPATEAYAMQSSAISEELSFQLKKGNKKSKIHFVK